MTDSARELAELGRDRDRLAEALRGLYEEAASSWADEDITEDGSYWQQGGLIRARTLYAARAALADAAYAVGAETEAARMRAVVAAAGRLARLPIPLTVDERTEWIAHQNRLRDALDAVGGEGTDA